MLRTVIFVLLILLPCVITKMSYYGGTPGSDHHPPFDLPPANTTFGEPDNTCASLCTGSVTPNPDYTTVNPGICATNPSFLPNGLPSPFNFDSCCGFQITCYQNCFMTKENCDMQTFGCLLDSCKSYLRPADNLNCRLYAICWASYFTREDNCADYYEYQSQACICGNATEPSNSTSPLNITSPSTTPSNSTIASPSTVPLNSTIASPSPAPSAALSNDTFTIKRSFVLRQAQTGTLNSYTPITIPNWSGYQSVCPPNSINWISVGTDQELEEIIYARYAAASNLKVWWK